MTRKAGLTQKLLLLAAAFMIGLSSLLPAHAETAKAEKPAWDRAANIKDAAERLGVLHKREGSQGVLKFLDACYRTHLLASDYNKGLEACMAADYMHSKVLVEVYARIPAQERSKHQAPSPEYIAKTMSNRFSSAFAQYKLPPEEAGVFKKLVDTHGFPVFVKAVFPKAETAPQGAPSRAKKEE